MNKKIGVIILACLISILVAFAATAPIVTLNTPADNAVDTDGDVKFKYFVTSELDIDECSLYTDLSGTWVVKDTHYDPAKGTLHTFEITNIPDNTEVEWNIKCIDSDLNESWGSEEHRTLTIDINDAPFWDEIIPDQTIDEDSATFTIPPDAYSVFDADVDDTIIFTVHNEDTSKVDCSISSDGTNLKITPASNFHGTATCKIRASDGVLYADDEFTTTVASIKDAPELISFIPDQTLVAGTSKLINLNNYFDDIDGDSLAYTAISADTTKITTSVPANKLTLTALADVTGTVNIDVTATDGTGTTPAEDSFTVTVRAAEAKLSIPSVLNLGSSTQERGTTIIGNFEIENTGVEGDDTLTGMKVSFDAAGSYDGEITFSTSQSGTYESELTISSLSPGNKQTVYVKTTIPAEMKGGISDIGDINVESDQVSGSFDLKVQTRSNLDFYDLDIQVESGTDNNVHEEEDGYTIDKNAKPGTEVEITFKLKNTFTSSEDIEIEDIEVEIILEGMGDDDEQEEVIEVKDIDADDKSKSYSVTFDIPYQLNEENYDLTFRVEGTDKNNAKHSFTKTYGINVVKDSHDIVIKQASASPSRIKAGQSSAVKIEIVNIGDNGEDDVVINIKNDALNINAEKKDIELSEYIDDDDKYSHTFNINIPEGTTAGTYYLTIDVYYDDDTHADTQELEITVYEDSATDDKEDEPDDVEVIIPDTTDDTSEDDSQITETYEEDFFSNGTTNILLIVGIVVVLILIGLLLVIAFRR